MHETQILLCKFLEIHFSIICAEKCLKSRLTRKFKFIDTLWHLYFISSGKVWEEILELMRNGTILLLEVINMFSFDIIWEFSREIFIDVKGRLFLRAKCQQATRGTLHEIILSLFVFFSMSIGRDVSFSSSFFLLPRKSA